MDRVLFVLGRSVSVAAPAGMILWLLAHFEIGDTTLLTHASKFLDPLGRILGMDGVILLAFVLALPANEIVIPIILMIYLGQGTLTETGSLLQAREILLSNGWTPITAFCVLIFFLFHWPCSTTLLTIKKETGSLYWTIVAALLPTALGALICITVRTFASLLGFP
jgi:ferrous iron transport protein B